MTNLPKTEKLVLELADEWLTIWLDSPENRNAFGDQLTAELIETLKAVREDRTVRGITIRGKHGIFCAGGDLKGFGKMQSGSHADVTAMNREAGTMFDLINTMPQVVIALVEGAAIAGGLGMMCCADVIVVTKDAKFSLTETMLGIPPAQISPIIVARVGLPMARRLMLTAARFDGEQAAAHGLADFAVDTLADLEAKEAEIKKGVLKCGPEAIAATKKLILSSEALDLPDLRDLAARTFADCLMSDEGKEGIASFTEKRKPNWAK